MFCGRLNQAQPSAPHGRPPPPLVLPRTGLTAVQHCRTLPWVMAVHSPVLCFASHCLCWLENSLVVLPGQNQYCCVLLFCPHQLDRREHAGTAGGQGEARRGCWTAHFHPGQTQVNKVNALLMSKARLPLVSSALRGGKAILYTDKETSKRSQEMKGEAAGAWRHQPGRRQRWTGAAVGQQEDVACLPWQRLAFALLSVRIEHKSTDLGCVMTELPGNSREPAVRSVKWKSRRR